MDRFPRRDSFPELEFKLRLHQTSGMGSLATNDGVHT